MKTKNIILFVILISLVTLSQNKKQRPVKIVEPALTENYSLSGTADPEEWAGYSVVDTMPNVYGPALAAINPVAADPHSGLVAVVFRGGHIQSAGSGELWYAYSTNNGITWNRSQTSVQDEQTENNLARYPSMAISNPQWSSNPEDVMFNFAWPELNSSPVQFDHIGYGADLAIDGSDFAAVYEGPVMYSSQVPIWTNDIEQYIFWVSSNQEDAGLTFFRTEDYTSIDAITPPEWSDEVFGSGGSIPLGGVSKNGVQYYGVLGTFPTEAFSNGFNSPTGWEIGYSKSTDNGTSWSEWICPNWPEIEATSEYTELWDYIKNDEFVSYQGDINVDGDGYVHLVTGITIIDTNISAEYGDNALVEFYETGDGWDAKIICEGELLDDSTFTQYEGVALGQMGPSVYLATDVTGEFFVAQWVTHTNSDSFFCDIYHSYRTKNGGWSDPVNITNTPQYNENATHLAPKITHDENNMYYHSFFSYPDPEGIVAHASPPITNPTMYYARTFQIAGAGIMKKSWQLKVTDSGNNSDNLYFGRHSLATDDLDHGLGENELPPPPPAGVFDARFILPDNVTASIIDYRKYGNSANVWKVNFQADSDGYPITLYWDQIDNNYLSWVLKDAINGSIVNVDMTAQTSFELTNSAISTLEIHMGKITDVEGDIKPAQFDLEQNYPNPFNPVTNIRFSLAEASDVKIKVFNVLGQAVKVLANKNFTSGKHTVQFDASQLTSGVYIYQIEANGIDGNNFIDTKKMILMK